MNVKSTTNRPALHYEGAGCVQSSSVVRTNWKSRYRFSCVTELDQSEQCAEPGIIRETTHCNCWPCDVIGDVWLKVKVFVAKRCKLACCQEYAWPHEWARRRRFCISKTYYMRLTEVTTREQDAILKWADLVASQEWRDGNWNERGVLIMADASKFPTQRVAWSIMEEYLAILAYSQNKQLVFLAARICMEALAKNRAMYTHSQQYWGFARILTDLLRSPHDQVTEGLLMALQLYLRTLKIFYSCFSHKCTEYASAGLFPVVLDALEKRTAPVQAVAANILLLMTMHAPYITLISNMGGLNILIKLVTTDYPLLKARVFACLEIMAKHEPAAQRLVQEGILPLAVRGLMPPSPPGLQLSCLFILNSLCRERRTLTKALAVDNYSMAKSCMRILTDWSLHISGTSPTRTLSPNVLRIQTWCTIPRQSLILLCKLCVDEIACKQLVKRGLVLKLRGVWLTWDMDRELVMEALAVVARWPRAGVSFCRGVESRGKLSCRMASKKSGLQPKCPTLLRSRRLYSLLCS
ncbi:hypothetical protein PoB_006242700 [Plakobranchus ocellatus]|uniref:Uncharacterized protein n=1 Tax=Plakobranchus ocellatus TaxID=259542 RepID=A0AAV4CVI5_9GAST|nr:hypothetical protein PoB_006242700 [Plakobranchus ocellatus]